MVCAAYVVAGSVGITLAYRHLYVVDIVCHSLSVRTEADVFDDSLTFAPSFTHQVFGEREVIFGYRNLKIKVKMEQSSVFLIPFFCHYHSAPKKVCHIAHSFSHTHCVSMHNVM